MLSSLFIIIVAVVVDFIGVDILCFVVSVAIDVIVVVVNVVVSYGCSCYWFCCW